MNIEIFLDTNVFESAKFSYTSENMKRLLEKTKNPNIKLKIVDVVKNEVEKRIKSNISDSLEPIDKNKLAIIASSLDLDPDAGKMHIINQLIDKLKKTFNTFLAVNDIEIISSNYDLTELTERYFNLRTPFTEQKKHEFPDAIILLTIKRYHNNNPDKTIATISNDNSFKEFAKENNIQNFDKISNALSFLIKQNETSLTNAFYINEDTIKTQIMSKVKSITDFILYSYDSISDVTVYDIHIKDASIKDFNITKVNESMNTIYLEFDLSILFSCKAYYPDPDSLHYDKEDGIYYYFTNCISDILFNENITCEVETYFDDELNFDDIELKIHNKEFEFYLDERYIQNTEYESDFH